MSQAHVARLFVYPLKGATGVELKEAVVTPRGLAHDRRFMVVDEHKRFVSQRTKPKLRAVRTELTDGGVTMRTPEGATVKLVGNPNQPTSVTVWDDEVQAYDAGDAAAQAISEALGSRCRIVGLGTRSERSVDPEYRVSDGDQVSFADGYPILVLSVGSLAELDEALDQPLGLDEGIRRFRPNVVLAGLEPFEEDSLTDLSIGDVRLKLVKRCSRCQVIGVDSACEPQPEPMKTLTGFRREGSHVYVGVNAIPVGLPDVDGSPIAQGATVRIRARGRVRT